MNKTFLDLQICLPTKIKYQCSFMLPVLLTLFSFFCMPFLSLLFFPSLNCAYPADHADCGCIISGHEMVDFGSTWLPSNCPGLSYQAMLTPRSRIPCFMFLFFPMIWATFSSYLPIVVWYELLTLEFWSQLKYDEFLFSFFNLWSITDHHCRMFLA